MAGTTAGRRGVASDAARGRQEEQNSTGPGRLVERMRGRISNEVNARKNRVTENLDQMAEAVRRIGEPLQGRPFGDLAQYTESAATRLEQIAGALRERDMRDLAGDVREFGRRRPAMLVAAGFAAGVLAARFLKSTAGEAGGPERRAESASRRRTVRMTAGD